MPISIFFCYHPPVRVITDQVFVKFSTFRMSAPPPKKSCRGFQPSCVSSDLHTEWNINEGKLVDSRYIANSTKQKLLELCNKTATSSKHKNRTEKFCQNCIDKVAEHFPEVLPEKSSAEHGYSKPPPQGKEDQYISLSQPDFSKVTQKDTAILAFELGKYAFKQICEAMHQVSSDKCYLVENLAIDSLLESQNPILLGFLAGISNHNFRYQPPTSSDRTIQSVLDITKPREMYRLYKTVESILHLVNPHITLPLHLQESMVLYSSTGSKMALQITSMGSPHASYQMVKNLLESLGSSESSVPGGDLVAAFDNNQILNRPWKVKLGAKYVVNIVTMVVLFTIDKNGTLQHSKELIPANWNSRQLTDGEKDKIKNVDQCDNIHRKHLQPFLAQCLKTVISEQKWQDEKWQDHIDIMVEEKRKSKEYRKCMACGFQQVPKGKHNCTQCKKNLKDSERKAIGIDDKGTFTEKAVRKYRQHEDRVSIVTNKSGQISLKKTRHVSDPEAEYTRFECKNANKVVETHLQKPIFRNPCAYDAVVKVLQGVGQRARIRKYLSAEQLLENQEVREWLCTYCDAVPLVLANRIIKCCFNCSECGEILFGTEMCKEHQTKTTHHRFEMEFDWLHLKPGGGHIEMNMLKGLVELLWDVFWGEMVKLYNFVSEAAQKAAKKVSDFHKGWTLARIARQAIALELMTPFVRTMMSNGENEMTISPAHFTKFLMTKVKDKTYLFISDIMFELVDSLFMYRCGVRCGDKDMMDAARGKFSKLWSGRPHPMYRELEMSDLLQEIRMPTELNEFIAASSSLNTTGRPYTGQGPDFRCEESNKDVQNILPNTPTGKDWNIACGGRDKVMKVREQLFKSYEKQDPKIGSKSPQANIDEEVNEFRALLREKEYLLHPLEQNELKSLNGDLLDGELLKFCSKSRDLRKRYVDAYLQYETNAKEHKPQRPKFNEKPIFITLQERARHEEISQQSPAAIKKSVDGKISEIKNEEMRETYLSVWKEEILTMNNKKPDKDILLTFYYEIIEYIEQEVIDQTDNIPMPPEEEDPA